MLAAAVVAATAFAPQPTLLPQTVVTPRLSAEPVMTAASSRRAALLTGAALTVSALPAFADSIVRRRPALARYLALRVNFLCAPSALHWHSCASHSDCVRLWQMDS